MVAPKIFISHSAKSNEEIKILWAIHDRLDAEGFEVLLDVSRLNEDAGGPWRTNLNTWIEICDSAILLFNERAQDASNWVVYETALLTWRCRCDPHFRLIPLVVPPADASNLGKGRFEPHQIDEKQAIRSDQPNYLDLIVETLKPICDNLKNVSTAPSAQIEDRLRSLLFDVIDDNAIISAAVLLGFDLTRWQPHLDRRRALAQLLLQADLVVACQAMRESLVSLRPEQLNNIREYLVPCWISCQAVAPIKDIALGPSRDRSIAVNTRDTRTLKMYLRRASGLLPDRTWTDIEVGPQLTTRPATQVVQEIIAAYRRRLLEGGATDLSDADVEELLNDITVKEPVFVLFSFTEVEPDATKLDQIRTRLPAITFFLPTGDAQPVGARFLEPALEPEVEARAIRGYRRAQMIWFGQTRARR